MNAIAQALMADRASKWLDHLEWLGTTPAKFAEFSAKFLEQFIALDDQNIDQNKLRMAWQQGSVFLYIAYFKEIIMDLPNASEDKLVQAYI